MAKYNVEHSCGHSQTHALFGPHKQRERKLEWLAGTLCTDCYRGEQDNLHATQSVKAAEANSAALLPALTGSEKQIAWAETLRAQAVAQLNQTEDELSQHLEKYPQSPAADQEMRDAMILLADEILQRTAARDWIDGRGIEYRLSWICGEILKRGLAPTAAAEAQADRKAVQ